ncbi:hypothetical protein [Pleurocapsa sp. FMAR1]|uniref:hypothetical protein n=1 Tax=Pleurocapsa sp. FMAR1 TaxID=3040204 RepID=UPI0029C85BAF|nr:hypothetical protein [Pleurocapsa sp. FMAR1]
MEVIHNDIAYLVWEMLEKKGNSHSDERMDLLERFYSILLGNTRVLVKPLF